jgi:hypothetical protein
VTNDSWFTAPRLGAQGQGHGFEGLGSSLALDDVLPDLEPVVVVKGPVHVSGIHNRPSLRHHLAGLGSESGQGSRLPPRK